MWLPILAVFAQMAPAPALKSDYFEDWAASQPIETSQRVSVLCRASGRLAAEFQEARGIVSVVGIEGMSHRLSNAERAIIDRAVRPLGLLTRLRISCDDRGALISVYGALSEIDGKMRQRSVSIVWQANRIGGIGGRRWPEMELEPAPR